MSSYLRKCLAFLPSNSYSHNAYQSNFYSFYQGTPAGGTSPSNAFPNPFYVNDTNTRWVRIFVNWHELQPYPGYAPGAFQNYGPAPNGVVPAVALKS